MGWPTPQDYNEAVQNPKIAFADSELQMGRPELTPLGLPRSITGNFASVYKLQCPQRMWAVRCFLRQFEDHERRYTAISEHLIGLRLPYTVGFTFLRDGIRVRGRWYPMLKMEWVQGESLSAFIERHLGNRSTLLSLARRWVEMVKVLQQASIAHGDLQHGNVRVVNGELRLIDYDGMWVPALSGERSHEVGHPNYQHPRRTGSDFGCYLDNFSAWVIYVSLIALATDPGLWKQFGGGDESLLFRRRDFEQPEASDVLRALERHRDEQIRSAIALFKSLLYLGPRDVPSLDGQIPPITVAADTGRTDSGSWIQDYVKLGAKVPAADTTQRASGEDNLAVPTPSDPSWILDALMPGPSGAVSFRNQVAPERFVLAFSATLVLLALNVPGLDSWWLGSVPVILLNVALWIYRYQYDFSVCELRDLRGKLRSITDRLQATERSIEEMNLEKTKLQNAKAAEQARLGKQQQALEAKEREEIDAHQAALQSALSSINARRRMLNQQEADALRRIQNDIGAKVATLNGRIADLNQAETAELNRALNARQKEHVAAYLRRFRLDRAFIQGIGPAFKERLMACGFLTAADVDFDRVQSVHGIGPTRARSLAGWRSCLDSQARSTMPSALSRIEAAAIRAKYEGQRRALEQQRDSEVQRQRKEEDNIRAQYRLLLDLRDQEEKDANARAQTAISEVRARYAQEYHAIRKSESKLAHDTASKLREIDRRIGEARKKLFGLHWRKEGLRRQIGPYVGIRFPKYVKRVFFGLQTG